MENDTQKGQANPDAEPEVPKPEPQNPAPSQKWWESKAIIALIALIVPLCGLLFNHIKYTREEAQARRKQDNEIQTHYLTLATQTNAGLQQQQMILRFIAATASDENVRGWASTEIKAVALEESKKIQDKNDLEAKFESLLSDIKKIGTGLSITRNDSAQVGKLLRLAEINRSEIDRLRKQIDNPAAIGPRPTSADTFRCLAGSITAQGGAGSGETKSAQCQSSLGLDGAPPNGVLELSGRSYSWVSNGVACSCTVSAVPD